MTEPQLSPAVAAFDLDGTLTEGGSVFKFLAAAAGTMRTAWVMVTHAPALAWAAIKGGEAADRTKEAIFIALLAGKDADENRTVSYEFAARHLRKRIRPEMRARLEWHRGRGDAIVIVSASPECYVTPIGELLRVDAVIATKLEVDSSGHLTGHYDGKNCRGFEKYTRLASWMRTHGHVSTADVQPVLYAYGNSRGDLRLLRAANIGVNCGKLGRISRLRSYPTLAEVTQAQVASD